MRVLVDTNILTRTIEVGHAQHRFALDATDVLGRQGHELFVVPQVLYEFWVVCTRPVSVNGLGRSASEANAELDSLKTHFFLLDDVPALFAEWERIVLGMQVVGKNAHDARLVAAMRIHKLTHLLTFNEKDFQRFGIGLLMPTVVAASTAGS